MLEAIFIIALVGYFIRAYRNHLWKREAKKAKKFLRRQQELENIQMWREQEARTARINKRRESKNGY